MNRQNDEISTENEMGSAEVKDVMRFMVLNKFNQCTMPVLQSLSYLVWKSTTDSIANMSKEYEKLAPIGANPESVRGQLSYYIKMNYTAFRESLHTNYDYELSDYYGIKTFVDQVAIAYKVFITGMY